MSIPDRTPPFRRQKNPGLKPGILFFDLLENGRSACFLELGNGSFRVCLRHSFLEHAEGLDRLLRLCKAKTRELADSLDDGDLVCAEILEDDVELRLFLLGGSGLRSACGTGNSYGHPHDAALSRLRDADVTLYRTDLQGTIICTSDGKNVSFTTAKNPTIQTNPTVDQDTAGAYIGNLHSKVFHRTTCSGLPLEKNRVYFDNRADAIAEGYTPCGRCDP